MDAEMAAEEEELKKEKAIEEVSGSEPSQSVELEEDEWKCRMCKHINVKRYCEECKEM